MSERKKGRSRPTVTSDLAPDAAFARSRPMDLKSWYRTEIGEIAVDKAWNLEQTGLVTHCFTTRLSGVSAPPCDTLNLALHVDDDPAHVIENRKQLSSALGLDLLAITTAEQLHGNAVAVVRDEHIGRGALDFADTLPQVDALITNRPGPALMLFFADCIPVFIVDPVHKAIGLAHAGWKGTAKSIAAVTVKAMEHEYGTNPSDCLAAIGPGIGRCCYDVSSDVATKVYEAAGDERVLARACQDQWRVDLKLANWHILRNSCIPESNIAVSDLCTACEADSFFSYRRDGATGRMAAILKIRE